MAKKIQLLGIVLPLLMMVFGTAPAWSQMRIVAFGTSFTNGHGVSRDESYPSQLERLLKSKGYNVVVDNAGVDGDSAAGGLARMDQAVPSDTRIAIVEFGVNEYCPNCSGRKFTDSEKAEVVPILRTMVDRLTGRGVKVILLSIRRVPVAAAAGGKAKVVNLAGLGLEDPKYALGDSMGHINGAGYTLLVARLAPVVESLLGHK